MGYSKELYEQAMRLLAERRMNAETAAGALRERAVARNPRVAELERGLTRSALQVAREVLNGMDGHRTGDITAAVQRLQAENQQMQKELAMLLHAMGEQADNFDPQPVCAVCSDTGYTGQRMCTCLETLLRELACEQLSALSNMHLTRFEEIDMRYYDADGARRHMEDVIAFCRDYAADFSIESPSLLLSGPPGTGKTHVSLAIAREAAMRGVQVIYGSVQRLLRQLEKEHFGKEDGDSMERIAACELLILDDLGTEFATQFYTASLYEIVNTRLLAGRPTVISTNLSQKQLQERYGAQIASRIGGHFLPLNFMGQDIRQQKLLHRLQND